MEAGEPLGSDGRFIRRTLILLGIGVTVLIAFVLRELLILVFGSVVLAVLLAAVTDLIQRFAKLKRGLALALAIIALLGLLGGSATFFRTQIMSQAQQLTDQLPDAWNQAQTRLGEWGIALPGLGKNDGSASADHDLSTQHAGDNPSAPKEGSLAGGSASFEIGGGLLGGIGSLLTTVFGAIAYTLLVLAGGIYFAAQPRLYRTGILHLFPRDKRPLIGDALDETGHAIKRWLLGTLFTMGLIGFITGIGLWLLGVPSPIALGLLAGLLEFVPIIGPIAAAIPAVLIALTQSTELALWTVALFILVQQVESNVVQPLVQRYAVDLPPALLLFSVVAGGYLFGIVGIIFAAPLTLATFVLVRRLYVIEALNAGVELQDQPEN